jgi:hypothetical protein
MLVFGIYALWVVVLWIGLPLAAVGAFAAYSEFKKADDPERKQAIHKNNAIALTVGSAILAAVAIWGNITTDKGPFGHSADKAREVDLIPKRFQGAYNSIACKGGHFEGAARIGGHDITYDGSVIFEVNRIVSQSDHSITLKVLPESVNGLAPERDFVVTFAEVGQLARLDGGEFVRCSQY